MKVKDVMHKGVDWVGPDTRPIIRMRQERFGSPLIDRSGVDAAETSCDRAPAVCAINVVATALLLVTPSSDSASRRTKARRRHFATRLVGLEISGRQTPMEGSTAIRRCACSEPKNGDNASAISDRGHR